MDEQVEEKADNKTDLGNALRVLVEIVSILLIAGFLLSSVANHLVFVEWGLDFLLHASPTDVLMSGLSLSITALMAFFAIIGASFFIYLIGLPTKALSDWLLKEVEAEADRLDPDREPAPFHRFRTDREFRELLTFPLNPVLILALLTAGPLIFDIPRAGPMSGADLGSLIFATGTAGIAIVAVSWILTEKRNAWVTAWYILLAGINAGGLVLGAQTALSFRSMDGYSPRPTIIVGETGCEGSPSRLLWAGSEKLVARCVGAEPKIVVLPTSEDFRFEVLSVRKRCETMSGMSPLACRFPDSVFLEE